MPQILSGKNPTEMIGTMLAIIVGFVILVGLVAFVGLIVWVKVRNGKK
jgi:type IV secretory pathway TrbD component